MTINRRQFLHTSLLGGASVMLLGAEGSAQEPKTINLGFQKTGIPAISRSLGIFEKRFGARGVSVNWVEFPSGLVLLQSLDVGSLNFGGGGNVGAIFVQASGGRIVYVAAQPYAYKGEGILVKDGSPIRSVADLKGKKVGYAKGSSSHNLIAAALEQAGLSINDIVTISLGAADAAFAFESDSIDAWVVWEPYFTIAQTRSSSRVLAFSGDVLKNSASFLLANADFAEKNPAIVHELVQGMREAGVWAKANLAQVTKSLAVATGIDEKILATVNANANFDVTPLSESILSRQQDTADRLFRLGLVPNKVAIRNIVWKDAPA